MLDSVILTRNQAPWIVELYGDSDSPLLLRNLMAKWKLRFDSFDGGLLKSKNDALRLLANRLNFEDYFGLNWDALEESLLDVVSSEQASYVVLIENADQLLVDEQPRELATFIDIFESIGAAQSVIVDSISQIDQFRSPLHLVLNSTIDKRGQLSARFKRIERTLSRIQLRRE